MHMWYWFGYDFGAFLFPGLNVTSASGLVAICFGLAALAILYEGMKIVQTKLRGLTSRDSADNEPRNTESSSLLSRVSPGSPGSAQSTTPRTECLFWMKWFVEVAHWTLHTSLSYLLMLAVMTYNGYISIAIIIGSAFGYWIFGPVLIQLNVARILKKRQIIKCDVGCSDAITNVGRQVSSVSIMAEQ